MSVITLQDQVIDKVDFAEQRLKSSPPKAVLPAPLPLVIPDISPICPLSSPSPDAPKTTQAASNVLPVLKTAAAKSVRCTLCAFRGILTALTLIGIIASIIATLPVSLIITSILSLYHLARKNPEKAKEIWTHFAKGSLVMVKNSAVKSFQACQKILDPNTSTQDWTTELLNLMIDLNGEVRNACSLANAVGSMTGTLLGVVLGPLRIYQGVLVCVVSIMRLIQLSRQLKEATPVERAEIELNMKSYYTYIAVGLLWMAMGAVMITTTVLFAGAPPLSVAISMAVITFLLFDVGFFTMSGFYIAQSRFAFLCRRLR